MNKITSRLRGNRFIPSDKEELSALQLIKKVVDKVNDGVNKINEYDINIKDNNDKINNFDKKIEKYIKIVDELPKTNAVAEVVEARKGEKTLGDKINTIDEQLETITKIITNYKNNTNTLDDAFDLCIKDCENGGKILFPTGEYILGKDFYIPSNVIIDFNNSIIKSNDTTKTRTICLKGSNIQAYNGNFVDVQISIGVSDLDQENIIVCNNTFERYDRAIHSYGSNKSISNILIENNTILNQKHESQGGKDNFCAIGFHGDKINISNCNIRNNYISHTCAFGILFYATNVNYKDVLVERNKIRYTGILRPLGSSDYSGTGGIYSGVITNSNAKQGIRIINNDLRYINEVGIEGSYYEVSGNYIEDTGYDALNRYIGDNAGIFGESVIINNNTVVNPGNSGAFKHYSTEENREYSLTNNLFINKYELWKSNTNYKNGDIVVSNNKYYICIKNGTSSTSAIDGKNANIIDGSTAWNYKKDLPQTCINITTTNKPNRITIAGNTIQDFKQLYYCTSPKHLTLQGNNFICKNINPVDVDTFVTGGDIIENISFNGSEYKNIILNDYFESWTSSSQCKNWINNNISLEQVEGSRNRKLPKIKNINSNGSGILSNLIYTENRCNLLFTVRFKTNNGIKLQYNDHTGWRCIRTLTDISEEFITKSFLVPVDKPQHSSARLEIYNKDISVIDGSKYIIIDWVKIEEIR